LPLLEQVDQLGLQIAAYDAMLGKIAGQRYPEETKVLCSVPGVGILTSLTYLLTLSGAQRFAHSRDELGLRPRQNQSGTRDRQLGISQAGNGYLRKLLVECSNHILGHFGRQSELREWGLAVAGRGGKNAKQRAIGAVARKLAMSLHRLWASQTISSPFFGKTAAAAVAG
jgi:transposase